MGFPQPERTLGPPRGGNWDSSDQVRSRAVGVGDVGRGVLVPWSGQADARALIVTRVSTCDRNRNQSPGLVTPPGIKASDPILGQNPALSKTHSKRPRIFASGSIVGATGVSVPAAMCRRAVGAQTLGDKMTRFALSLAIAVAISCASHPTGPKGAVSELGAAYGYTLVNLHPDNERSRLYAVNFQQAGLIPVCSEVKYVDLGRKVLRFEVVSTKRVYEYLNHKAAAEPFPDHLRRFFGPECPSAEIETLSKVDRQGIREGRALVGMSRRGIVIALGHPPRHVNPDPNTASYIYWKNRFNRIQIQFDGDGLVSSIRN
jgi:hypothetical protein